MFGLLWTIQIIYFFLICLTYIRAGLHIYDCHNKIYLIHQYQYKSLTIVRNEAFVISEADIDIYIFGYFFAETCCLSHEENNLKDNLTSCIV